MEASRRRFLKLAAGGAAVMMVGSLATAREAAAESEAPSTPAGRALETEIEKQKRSVAKTLETIRAYELPDGSEPGFVFTPIAPRAAGKPQRSR